MNYKYGKLTMFTDTATLCLYDLECLKHRVEDTSDWWSIPEDELAEVNAGHCLFVNLGADGTYEVEWDIEEAAEAGQDEKGKETGQMYNLRIPSGHVYLGAADDVSGGELEPDESSEGVLLQIQSGNYSCSVSKEGNKLSIMLQRSEKGENNLNDLIRV